MTHLPDRAFLGAPLSSRSPSRAASVSIGDGAFAGCSSLVSIDLPASLTSISRGSFYRCSSLTTITLPLPDGLSIGNRAFFDCPLDDEAKAVVRAINVWAVRLPIDAQGPLCRRA